ncbi:PREDICTED: B-cell lymphoma 3 protein-like [Rhinopithecus bieti]|uniref:B-cell lymphoma 3 protein-like n=1 Tax=Rhinopithecus bieti TaxID=61621 RepID=UPI00083BB5E0|nr:PREDICTED: B-cell lymphoma 3 protein-like [Rhinopithecus bieti]
MGPPLLNLRQEVSQVSVPGEDCRMRSKGSENLREAGLESRAGHRSLTVTVPQTPLHLAVITTLPSVVRLLVTAGASPMALDRHGQTAAHLACEHRSPTCLRALLDSAAPGTLDLEARNYDGLTALHVAVNTECQETVQLLLERGADIDAVDIKSGRSPLIHAVENNSLSMVQLLLQVRTAPLSLTPTLSSDRNPALAPASSSGPAFQFWLLLLLRVQL